MSSTQLSRNLSTMTPKNTLQYFDYLDWVATSQAERRILYDMLFKEPEASEAQRHLFQFLVLNPGEVIPPIPSVRLPADCQREAMTYNGNIDMRYPNPPYSFGIIPVVTSGHNGQPLANQALRTNGGVGVGPGQHTTTPEMPQQFSGQSISVHGGPTLHLYHHIPHQQHFVSPNCMTKQDPTLQHFQNLIPAGHISYPVQLLHTYGTETEEGVREPVQLTTKTLDGSTVSSSTPSQGNTDSDSGKESWKGPGPLRPQERRSEYIAHPYYPGMESYSGVYYNPPQISSAAGQIIFSQPKQPIYEQHTSPQHFYPELKYQTPNLEQVPLDTTQELHRTGKGTTGLVEHTYGFVHAVNTPNASASSTSTSDNKVKQACSDSPLKVTKEPNDFVKEDLKIGVKGLSTSSNGDPVVGNSIVKTKQQNVKLKSSPEDDHCSDSELGIVNTLSAQNLRTVESQSNINARSPPSKTGQDDKGNSIDFPELPSASAAITNGGVNDAGATPAEKTYRSWASIASASKVGGGGSIDTAFPQALSTESRAFPSVNFSENMPTGPVDTAFGQNRKSAFNPECLSRESDPVTWNLGEFLLNYQLNHHCWSLTPRGLVNPSNFCYINATLQSLLACPPFVNLFRSMEHIIGKKPCNSTPILKSVFDFVMEFQPIRHATNNKSKRSTQAFVTGPPFDPTGIRRVLSLLDGATFKVEGRQEDAEEFLSHLLNGIHDEMVKIIRWHQSTKECKSGKVVQQRFESDNSVGKSGVETADDGDAEWQVMGPKNKGSMTRKTEISESPISEMFVGQMSSLLNRENNPKTTTLQPFFTLQLDIQGDNIHSVKDALEGLSTKEEVSGISGVEADAPIWKQLSLEFLPIILVIHLKRFVYDKNCSKIFKLDKRVDFGVDLVIEKDLLSVNCRSRLYPLKQRSYKLFAVVYHDGEETHKGHYVADTFHPSGGSLWGQSGWIRYDDSDTKCVTENQVLTPQPPRVPYLLYYRRVDTLSLQTKKYGSV